MTQRKLARRRRRWRIPRFARPKYEHLHALHAYEEELLLATLRERGGYGSVESLVREAPERWRRGYLTKVFRRLHRQRRLERLGRAHSRRVRYDIPKGDR